MFKMLQAKFPGIHHSTNKGKITEAYDVTVTVDSPSSSSTVPITSGQITEKPPNEHEADYALWHHCIQETSQAILVV